LRVLWSLCAVIKDGQRIGGRKGQEGHFSFIQRSRLANEDMERSELRKLCSEQSMKNKIFVAALSAALAVLSVSAFAGDNSKFTHYSLMDAATGKPTSLAALKGKYKAIYIDFFAIWCGPCQGEIKKVIALHNQFASKGVGFVGVDIWESVAAMKQDMQMRGINYSVMHDNAPSGKGILTILGLQGIPVVVILDGKTLAQKGIWKDGLDPTGKAEAQQVALLKAMGAK
jgi:thiol-disulfide isomerase/thioredoxin